MAAEICSSAAPGSQEKTICTAWQRLESGVFRTPVRAEAAFSNSSSPMRRRLPPIPMSDTMELSSATRMPSVSAVEGGRPSAATCRRSQPRPDRDCRARQKNYPRTWFLPDDFPEKRPEKNASRTRPESRTPREPHGVLPAFSLLTVTTEDRATPAGQSAAGMRLTWQTTVTALLATRPRDVS